ncbi:AbrB/MazE/SpoVT family DNA-binding domain-containing protein [Eubacteriales bacterium OttesenSCG-928-G02]|nr:AbrB/MazE/SpoVT family DNA-binding domain-containing protein [Eubacteriales bacterium OttesenSCG-928-G02]
MKNTGVVRNLDLFGRVVLPMELRKNLGITDRDPMEFFIDGDKLVLRKYTPSCFFCNSSDDTVLYTNKLICKNCAKNIADLL